MNSDLFVSPLFPQHKPTERTVPGVGVMEEEGRVCPGGTQCSWWCNPRGHS